MIMQRLTVKNMNSNMSDITNIPGKSIDSFNSLLMTCILLLQ